MISPYRQSQIPTYYDTNSSTIPESKILNDLDCYVLRERLRPGCDTDIYEVYLGFSRYNPQTNGWANPNDLTYLSCTRRIELYKGLMHWLQTACRCLPRSVGPAARGYKSKNRTPPKPNNARP